MRRKGKARRRGHNSRSLVEAGVKGAGRNGKTRGKEGLGGNERVGEGVSGVRP